MRFQIAQEDPLVVNEDERNVDVRKLLELAEKSDLVKGVYEGSFAWNSGLSFVKQRLIFR